MTKVFVIGYGNTLRGDDGAGYRAAQELSWKICDPRVIIRACHQLLPELLPEAMNSESILFIDATIEREPGSVLLEPVLESTIKNRNFFLHSFTPSLFMEQLWQIYHRKPSAFLLSITGKEFSLTEQFSKEVESSFLLLRSEAERFIKARIEPMEKVCTN